MQHIFYCVFMGKQLQNPSVWQQGGCANPPGGQKLHEQGERGLSSVARGVNPLTALPPQYTQTCEMQIQNKDTVRNIDIRQIKKINS